MAAKTILLLAIAVSAFSKCCPAYPLGCQGLGFGLDAFDNDCPNSCSAPCGCNSPGRGGYSLSINGLFEPCNGFANVPSPCASCSPSCGCSSCGPCGYSCSRCPCSSCGCSPCSSGSCARTVVRPRLVQNLINVPVVRDFVQTLAAPAIEKINYFATPANCPQGPCGCGGKCGCCGSCGCGAYSGPVFRGGRTCGCGPTRPCGGACGYDLADDFSVRRNQGCGFPELSCGCGCGGAGPAPCGGPASCGLADITCSLPGIAKVGSTSIGKCACGRGCGGTCPTCIAKNLGLI